MATRRRSLTQTGRRWSRRPRFRRIPAATARSAARAQRAPRIFRSGQHCVHHSVREPAGRMVQLRVVVGSGRRGGSKPRLRRYSLAVRQRGRGRAGAGAVGVRQLPATDGGSPARASAATTAPRRQTRPRRARGVMRPYWYNLGPWRQSWSFSWPHSSTRGRRSRSRTDSMPR